MMWEQLDTCVSWLGSKLQDLFRHSTDWGSNEEKKKFSGGADTVEHRHFYTITPQLTFILLLLKKKQLRVE